jgi:CheY-like chemotaxis protein
MPPIIVIAEDDVGILELLALVLEDEGYCVRRTTDGVAALAQLAAERADLLLTDNMMPQLSGLALIDRVPARSGPPLPIILMSAATPEPFPAPPTIFVPKPFDLDALIGLVRRLLQEA